MLFLQAMRGRRKQKAKSPGYILMVFILCIVGSPLVSNAQINYQHFLRTGQYELQKENYLLAINNFNTAIYSKPDGFEAYFLRGIAKFSLGDFQGASNDFTKTIDIHPLYTRAYHYRGISRDRIYDYAHAISDFDKALEIDPFNPDVFLARGDTKMHVRDFRSAIDDYSEAINLNPKVAAAWLNRGICQHFLGNNTEALSDVDQAIYLDYFDVEAWTKRGMIKLEIDSLEPALDDFNHAITLDDKNPYVFFQRALTHLKLQDTTAAMKDYDTVIALDPNNALTFYNRGLVKSIRREYDAAIADYNQVTKINPYNVYTYFNRGIIYIELENYEEAEKDFSTAIEIYPEFAGAYINRSLVREKLRDKRGAISDHDEAMAIIERANAEAENYENLYKRYQDSIYFNKIIELEADFVSGDRKKGRVQFQRVSILPKPNFFLVYAFQLPDSVYFNYQKDEYFDKHITQFNANNKMGMRFVFTTRNWPVSQEKAIHELQRIDSSILLQGDTAGTYFIKGMINSMLQNYTTAINAYDVAIAKDSKISYAYLNRGTTRYELDEFIYSEQQYSNAITISRNAFKKQASKPKAPSHRAALDDYSKVIRLNPNLPFVYYNRANVKLSLKQFHRAIDDYSMAIKIEPEMAEAYYNRALTLLYLDEIELACKDLSKAGELGITEAYNVIKRYCNK